MNLFHISYGTVAHALLLCGLFGSIGAGNCLMRQGSESESRLTYFPMAKGSYWLYTSENDFEDTLVIRITDKFLSQKETLYAVEEMWPRISLVRRYTLSYGNGSHNAIFRSPDHELPSDTTKILGTSGDQRSLWYDTSAKPGESWTVDYQSIPEWPTEQFIITLASIADEVSVDEDVYERCIRFEFDHNGHVYAEWLSLGIGIVKRQYPEGVYLLRKYELR